MVPPGAYEERWSKWSLANLPIFPETFRYEVPKEKQAQFSIVKKELQSADTIIIATDGDRYIVSYCNKKGSMAAFL